MPLYHEISLPLSTRGTGWSDSQYRNLPQWVGTHWDNAAHSPMELLLPHRFLHLIQFYVLPAIDFCGRRFQQNVLWFEFMETQGDSREGQLNISSPG